MLLWLPIFTGSALAASVSMQLPQGACNEEMMSQQMSDGTMNMNMDMGDHTMHHGEMPAPAGMHGNCGVCHMACVGYLTVPDAAMPVVQTTVREVTPYLVAFTSVTTTPLLPPPLVRA